STLPGLPAASVGKRSVCGTLPESTSYAVAALPGMIPPPPSHVVPPSADQATHIWFAQLGSDCTVPAADSAAHVAGLLPGAGVVNATYGLPSRSSVNPANGEEVSCPMPASYASCGVQLLPPSSDPA